MTEAEKILKSLPSEAPFELRMVADSSNYASVDIPTKMGAREAWHLVGVMWVIESTDMATVRFTVPAASVTRLLQIHRNTTHDEMIDFCDEDLLFYDRYESRVLTSVGVDANLEVVQRHMIRNITTSPALRIAFQCNQDDNIISDPNFTLRGILHYHIVSAPDDGRTKLGIPIDEI